MRKMWKERVCEKKRGREFERKRREMEFARERRERGSETTLILAQCKYILTMISF